MKYCLTIDTDEELELKVGNKKFTTILVHIEANTFKKILEKATKFLESIEHLLKENSNKPFFNNDRNYMIKEFKTLKQNSDYWPKTYYISLDEIKTPVYDHWL